MWIIFIFLIAGILVGFIFRNRPKTIVFSSQATAWAVFLLIFFLGLSVGQNDAVVSALGELGWQAILLSSGSILGSLIFTGVLYFFAFRGLHEK